MLTECSINRGLLPTLMGAGFLIFFQAPSTPLPAREASFTHLRSADVPVVEYVKGTGELAGEGNRVTIYGDGQVEVKVPQPFADAGKYTAQIPAIQLDSLLTSFVTLGLVEIDPEAIRERKSEVHEERRREAVARGEPLELSAIADAPTTRLRFQLENYVPAGDDLSPRPVDKELIWYALEWHVEEYPELDALERLLEATRKVEALIQTTELEASK